MPFYQFNQFTGRLKETSHLNPLNPITARPLESAEPLAMIWDTKSTRPVQTAATTTSSKPPTLSPKIYERMKHFQKDIESPVYIKGGKPDVILFRITAALVIAGVANSFRILYGFAKDS